MTNDIKFYHGTDRRLLEMSASERLKMRDCIERINSFIWPYLEPYDPIHSQCGNYTLYKILKNDEVLMYNLLDKMVCWEKHLKGDSKYQYQKEGIYLAAHKVRAANYARRASCYGEIGAIAYTFLKAIEKIKPINWNPSENIKADIEFFLQFKNEKPQPVIVHIKGLPIEKIESWKGVSCSQLSKTELNNNDGLRYVHNIELANYFIEDLQAAPYTVSEDESGPLHNWSAEPRPPQNRDYVRVISDCGQIPAVGDICQVCKVHDKEIDIIPNHHFMVFTIPSQNVEVVTEAK